MKAKIILRQDMPSLGNTGDVVTVEQGYARNYLIPRNMAFPFSADGLRRVEKDRKRAEQVRLAQMAEFEALAKRLEGVQLTFEERVSEEGHLFGSVSAHAISNRLAEQGLKVKDSDVRLSEPLREVGEYEIPIHVHGDLETSIKIWVVAEKAAEA